jgi:ABC-type antimicrobial peptide transport system permease subunit
MVLGAVGTGLVVFRNAAARRRELAILRAVGLPPRQILGYLAAEHLYLVGGGLAAGIIPALVAVHPAIVRLGQELPVGLMATLIVAMIAAGLLGTLAAVSASSRLRLIEALRGE